MKKKMSIILIVNIAALILAFALSGCGGSRAKDVVPARSGLIGRYKGVDPSGKQYFHVDISESSIEVRYSFLPHQEFALYWRGTFPQTTDKTIVSKVDRQALIDSSAVFPADSDTQVFKYVNGELTFDAVTLGVTRHIHLKN